MERYEEYKDSGVERIGEIPAEWEAARLKTHLVKNQGGVWGSDPRGDGGTVVLRSTEQTVDGNWDISDPAIRDLSEESDADSRILEEGDLLVTKSSGSALHIGKTTIVDEAIASMRCSYSNFMQRLRSGRGLTSRFCWYFLNSDLAREQYCYLQNSTSGLGNLTSGTISGIMIPVPPVDDQEAIVSYLDAKTAEVDSLVKDCEREVELLQEYRKAVVSEAVTKGLDPNAPMKDSGIDWIGEIPEEWMLSRVKNVTFSYARIGFRGYRVDDLVDEGEGALTLSPSNLAGSGLDLSKVSYLSWCKYEESPEIQLGVGDVLLTKTGSSYGKTAYITKLSMPATINPQLMVFKRIQGVAKYFYYLTCTDWFQLQIERCVVGGTIPTISQEAIRNMYICWPDSEQQDTIVAYLDTKTAEIDSLIADYQSMADKLREYRKSLISEAVTGKFKVPGVA